MTAGRSDLNTAKLCMLFVLHRANVPLTRQQLEDILLGHLGLHYFDVSQASVQLISSDLIREQETPAGSALHLLPAGREVLLSLEPTIPGSLYRRMNEYMQDHGKKLRQQAQTGADYRCVAHGQYVAELWMTEGTIEIMRIRLNVPTADEARKLCERWQAQSSALFAHILTSLLSSVD